MQCLQCARRMKRKVVEIVWDDASSNVDKWQSGEPSESEPVPNDFLGMPCVSYGILLLDAEVGYRIYMTRSTEGARAIEFDIPRKCVRRIRVVAEVPNLCRYRGKITDRQLVEMQEHTKGDEGK